MREERERGSRRRLLRARRKVERKSHQVSRKRMRSSNLEITTNTMDTGAGDHLKSKLQKTPILNCCLRNPGQIEDGRLQYLKSHWFEEKEVLDIGCNIGHITIRLELESRFV